MWWHTIWGDPWLTVSLQELLIQFMSGWRHHGCTACKTVGSWQLLVQFLLCLHTSKRFSLRSLRLSQRNHHTYWPPNPGPVSQPGAACSSGAAASWACRIASYKSNTLYEAGHTMANVPLHASVASVPLSDNLAWGNETPTPYCRWNSQQQAAYELVRKLLKQPQMWSVLHHRGKQETQSPRPRRFTATRHKMSPTRNDICGSSASKTVNVSALWNRLDQHLNSAKHLSQGQQYQYRNPAKHLGWKLGYCRNLRHWWKRG